MKGDIRRLDTKLDTKIDFVLGRVDAVDDKVDLVKDSLASAKIWALGLYIALAGAMFAVLARGFGWV